MRTEANEAIARSNNGLLDLQRGDLIRDEEGEQAVFISYGDREPLYVNLKYAHGLERLPNSNFEIISRRK